MPKVGRATGSAVARPEAGNVGVVPYVIPDQFVEAAFRHAAIRDDHCTDGACGFSSGQVINVPTVWFVAEEVPLNSLAHPVLCTARIIIPTSRKGLPAQGTHGDLPGLDQPNDQNIDTAVVFTTPISGNRHC